MWLAESRKPVVGGKLQAASAKLQATSGKQQALDNLSRI